MFLKLFKEIKAKYHIAQPHFFRWRTCWWNKYA